MSRQITITDKAIVIELIGNDKVNITEYNGGNTSTMGGVSWKKYIADHGATTFTNWITKVLFG